MRLFFGALVLTCMLFFDEIQASFLRINTAAKQKNQEGSSVDHLATSRAHLNSVPTHNQPSLGQRALDLHANPLDVQEYSHQQSSEEPSRPKRKSRKKKDIDLDDNPSQTRAPKRMRDLNKKVYIAKDTITTRQITESRFGEGTNLVMDDLEIKENVSEDVRRREEASLAHFHQVYGYAPPLLLGQQLGWSHHGYLAPQFLPQPQNQFGVSGQYGHNAPLLRPHSQSHPGGSGTHGYASLPFHQNVEDQSGGYGTQGYADPSVPPNPWGNYECHGSSYGGSGSGTGM